MPRKNNPTADTPTATTGGDIPFPLAVPDEVIDQTVQDLNSLYDRTGLEAALAAGRLVVERFYGGDLALARETSPDKHQSFRKLSQHPDLLISAATVHRHVSIYEMCERLGVSPGKHLGVSHLREVIGLPDDAQKTLISKAEEKGWTRRELEAAAGKVRKKLGGGRGRTPLPGFVKGIRQLGKMADDTSLLADLDDDHLGALDADQATQLYQAVTRMRLRCEELQQRLQAVTPGFGGGAVIDVEADRPRKPAKKESKKGDGKPKGYIARVLADAADSKEQPA